MNITLKKIQHYEKLSEETNAFSAEVYIEGKHVGSAKNDGRGGMTDLQFYHEKDSPLRKLCEAAEAWAAQQNIFEGVAGHIDQLIYDDLIRREKEKFEKKMQKDFTRGFVVGVPNSGRYSYSKLPNGMSFVSLLAQQNIPAKRLIESRIVVLKKNLKAGEELLNAEYLRSLGLVV